MVARLTTSGLVDRRDDPFDPTRGWFTSAGLELSRPGLGSDLSFLKSYLQYFQFVPIRDDVVLASAVRVGLARTFRDEDLIPSERFFGGGATSVRGYRQDDLGPRSIFGDASGGRALFIGNGELRFPIHRWLRGVGFVDLGNVYETVGDITLTNLQVGTGAGIRLDTPIGLLRLDVAVPANPRPFDPKWSTSLRPRPRVLTVSRRSYLPRPVRMIDSTAGRSGAFGASLRKFSKYTAIRSMRLAL